MDKIYERSSMERVDVNQGNHHDEVKGKNHYEYIPNEPQCGVLIALSLIKHSLVEMP